MALSVINIIFYVALSFALIFQCQPLEKAWIPEVAGKCINQDALLTSSGPFNIVSDFLIFLLPAWAIYKLQLPIRRRLEVMGAFAIALFGCICSAIRLIYSRRLEHTGDATWVIFQNQLWANAEITAGILIASLFVVPRLIRHWKGQDTGYASTGGNKDPSRDTHQHATGNSNQGDVWARCQAAPRSKRFSDDSYFELEEVANKFPVFVPAAKAGAHGNNARIHSQSSCLGNAKPQGQINFTSSIRSQKGEGKAAAIVKTVNIEWTEEITPVGIPRAI